MSWEKCQEFFCISMPPASSNCNSEHGSLGILAHPHKEIRIPCAWPEVRGVQNQHLFTSAPAETWSCYWLYMFWTGHNGGKPRKKTLFKRCTTSQLISSQTPMWPLRGEEENQMSKSFHEEQQQEPSFVVVQLLSCVRFCNTMDCSTPGFPVHHHLPEFAQTHVHWDNDAIQLSHPLLSPSPPAYNLPRTL